VNKSDFKDNRKMSGAVFSSSIHLFFLAEYI